MRENTRRAFDWTALPLIATVARLLCRELTLQNEYLRQENKVLRSKVRGRIRFDDEERRFLANAALAMSRNLMRQVVPIVKPETILKWQRRLERRKWDYSKRPRRAFRVTTALLAESAVPRLKNGLETRHNTVKGRIASVPVLLAPTLTGGGTATLS